MRLSAQALEFAPGLLAIQESPPARLPRAVLRAVAALFVILLVWSMVGRLDIIASAEGRLVPQTYVKIVQPADAGIVQEIAVKEGDHVAADQVLMRMDMSEAKADASTLSTQLAMRSLQLRRIETELANTNFVRRAGDPQDLFREVDSQYHEHRQAYLDALNQAQAALAKAQHDFTSGNEVLTKLREITPMLKEQADSYAKLAKDGFVSQLGMRDKQREYLEKAGDLKAQEAAVASLAATVAAASKQVAQTTSKYRSDLQNERVDAEMQYRKLQQDRAKQEHRNALLELRAPQAGVVKDLATHTVGSVVSPGTVLLSLVPDHEPLVAEVMVRNEDVGFVYPHQKVKLKVASYPFQKYGMLSGEVLTIGPDATDGGKAQKPTAASTSDTSAAGNSIYKAIVLLDAQQLEADGERYRLVAGMQVIAEINEGRRTVMQYLLSPVQKAFHEGARER